MSRYHDSTGPRPFFYGYDACGIPGYFVRTDKGYDTRRFMADPDCHVSRGRIAEMLTEMNEQGASVPEEHLLAIVLDLPF